jgi:hypothetical protein
MSSFPLSFAARLVVCAFVALAASACQTPWTHTAVRDGLVPISIGAIVPPAVQPAPIAPTIAPPEAPPLPTLQERLAELLVRRAPDMAPSDRLRVAGAIHAAYQTHGVDPLLVMAIIEQESRFETHARGSHNSLGLMQVRPFVARDVAKRNDIPWNGEKTLFDPAANVSIGACYLGEMIEMHGDPALAIAAYNMGPYRVQRMVARGHTPRPAYLISVLKRFQSLSSEFGPLPDDPIQDASAD